MTKHQINIFVYILTIGILTLFFRNESFFWNLIIVTTSLFLFILSLGILFLKVQYFLPAINKLSSKKVLLTFDDGPYSETTPKILEVLNSHSIGGIFFVIGSKVKEHPEIVRKIHENGYFLGNHTYEHSNFFSMLSSKNVEQEIEKCDQIIEQLTGEKSIFFRPPIGYTNPRIARVVKKMNKIVIGWQLRSYDSVLKNPMRLKNRLLRNVKTSDIILIHDNLPQSAEMLEDFIVQAKKDGIIFATKEDIKKLL